MRYIHLSLVIISLLAVSCSPRVTSHLSGQYGPLPADEEVTVLPVGAAVPAAAERLGDVVVKDSGFSSAKNGTFSAVLDLAKQEARGAGGNVLLLTDHRKPDFSSTIHRIRADVYRADSAAIVPVAEFIPSPALVDTVYPEMNVRVKMPKTFVVGLWGGGGFRTNRMDPQLTGKEREYASALRWGFDFGADAVYYFGNWGLGVRYSSLRAHHRDDMVVSTSEGQRTGMLDTHSNIWFLGPVAGFREPFGDNGNCLYSIIGVGYMGYKQEQVFRSYYPVFIKGLRGFREGHVFLFEIREMRGSRKIQRNALPEQQHLFLRYDVCGDPQEGTVVVGFADRAGYMFRFSRYVLRFDTVFIFWRDICAGKPSGKIDDAPRAERCRQRAGRRNDNQRDHQDHGCG